MGEASVAVFIAEVLRGFSKSEQFCAALEVPPGNETG
jgi:hypothetical protein